MSLRTRIALIVATVALLATAGGFTIQRAVFLERFRAIERQEVLSDVRHCEDEIQRELRELASFARDWGNWDDTYEFVQGRFPDFDRENLNRETMENVRANVAWFLDADRRVVRAWGLDFDSGEALEFDELREGSLPGGHPLLATRTDRDSVSGILRTSRGPLLVACSPVLRSDHTGPAVGWFAAGRLLTPGNAARLGRDARVDLAVHDVHDESLPPEAREAVGSSADEAVAFAEGDDTISAYRAVHSLDGAPVLVLVVSVPRDITREGTQAVAVATAMSMVSGVTTIGVLVLLLGATVATPLRRLTDHAVGIGRSGDLSKRSGIRRADEIGVLARAFDDMVARLAESREQVAEAARLVGRADFARAVLHNVGNVLTSVNVSAGTIGNTVRTSRADGVLRAIDLVAANRDDLARWVAEDPRGRLIGDYLVRAGDALRAEREVLLAEVERLQGAVAHASQIVARQGEFAAGPPLVERCTLGSAIGASAALVQPEYDRTLVTLVRQVDEQAVVAVDRNRLSQILVNLLTNAKEAVLARGDSARRVVLDARVRDGRLLVRVEDDGCGIAEDSLTRVFASGFSTKPGSRGVGLHYCAVTAREMGGSLRAESGGPGLGATFLLDLPAGAAGAPAAPAPPARAAAAPESLVGSTA